jgi:hypothetical protein
MRRSPPATCWVFHHRRHELVDFLLDIACFGHVLTVKPIHGYVDRGIALQREMQDASRSFTHDIACRSQIVVHLVRCLPKVESLNPLTRADSWRPRHLAGDALKAFIEAIRRAKSETRTFDG